MKVVDDKKSPRTPAAEAQVIATSTLFRAARIDRGWCGRFMSLEIQQYVTDSGAILYSHDTTEDGEHYDGVAHPVFGPVGGKQPSTFKTLRNARKAAGKGGFVLLFDPRSLPLVAIEATHPEVDNGNEIDALAFAERQMLFWHAELERISKRARHKYRKDRAR